MIKGIIIVCIFLMLGACSPIKTNPCGFWTAFKTEYLKNNSSNQGVRGGYTTLHWKAEGVVFNPTEILSYANKNNWVLVDSVDVDSKDLLSWTYFNTPIFPLSHTGFSTVSSNNAVYKNFPRWITKSSKVYLFKTGWITIDPGTDESINVNGFVLVSNDHTEMSVYHLWGE
jgi:hypothetical protein